MTAVASAASPTFSDSDLMAIGMVMLNIVASVQQHGHASPASTLDYLSGLDLLDGNESAAGHIVRDFIAWTCGRTDMSPGCDERLKAYIAAHTNTPQPAATRHRRRRTA